jgi:hypothetical protein
MPFVCDGLNTSDPSVLVDSLPRASCRMPIVGDHCLDRVAMRLSGGRDAPACGRSPPDPCWLGRGRWIVLHRPFADRRDKPSVSGRGLRISLPCTSISRESVVAVVRSRHVFVVLRSSPGEFARRPNIGEAHRAARAAVRSHTQQNIRSASTEITSCSASRLWLAAVARRPAVVASIALHALLLHLRSI